MRPLFPLEVTAAHGRDDVKLALFRLYKQTLVEAAKAGRIRRDLDPEQLAVALEGIVSAMVDNWIHSRRKRPLTAQTDLVLTLFMKGAGAR